VEISKILAGLLLITCLSGCADKKPYALAPVSGLVVIDGKPAPERTAVSFQPREPAFGKPPGPASAAFCDANGRYQLQTLKDETGAAVGTHKVSIYSARDPNGPEFQQEKIPKRYNFESELTFTVPAGGTAEADFELTTSP
jgi:hypothetical protein